MLGLAYSRCTARRKKQLPRAGDLYTAHGLSPEAGGTCRKAPREGKPQPVLGERKATAPVRGTAGHPAERTEEPEGGGWAEGREPRKVPRASVGRRGPGSARSLRLHGPGGWRGLACSSLSPQKRRLQPAQPGPEAAPMSESLDHHRTISCRTATPASAWSNMFVEKSVFMVEPQKQPWEAGPEITIPSLQRGKLGSQEGQTQTGRGRSAGQGESLRPPTVPRRLSPAPERGPGLSTPLYSGLEGDGGMLPHGVAPMPPQLRPAACHPEGYPRICDQGRAGWGIFRTARLGPHGLRR